MKKIGPDHYHRYKYFEPVEIPDVGIWREEYACGHVEGFQYYMRPLSFHLPANLRPEIMAQMPRDYEDADDLTRKILDAVQNQTLPVVF
ncbi:hypothetical protein M378DRAFT_169010 [Amanita muscaria Koide BX008]|uniref:Uncharacterized protein n=1 Tax=Amanita muscaria (strain Koide BX008) TaxID=946122 RepID=A0A0C2SZP9_AMAMK|nr:hypothetical protein M378DRAFT_169010 [Amanita muscaria Koide BX008]